MSQRRPDIGVCRREWWKNMVVFRASRPVPPHTSISSLLRLSALQTELDLLKSSPMLMALALVPAKRPSHDGERLGSSAVASAWLSWVLCPWPSVRAAQFQARLVHLPPRPGPLGPFHWPWFGSTQPPAPWACLGVLLPEHGE